MNRPENLYYVRLSSEGTQLCPISTESIKMSRNNVYIIIIIIIIREGQKS